MKKGDVGMAKTFYKKHGNREWAFFTLYLQTEINFCSVRMPIYADATSVHHCLINKQLKLRIQQNECLLVGRVWLLPPYTWQNTMPLEKYCTCCIERRWHITTALLQCWLQACWCPIPEFNIRMYHYWWWFWRQWCRDIWQYLGKGTNSVFFSKSNYCYSREE